MHVHNKNAARRASLEPEWSEKNMRRRDEETGMIIGGSKMGRRQGKVHKSEKIAMPT